MSLLQQRVVVITGQKLLRNAYVRFGFHLPCSSTISVGDSNQGARLLQTNCPCWLNLKQVALLQVWTCWDLTTCHSIAWFSILQLLESGSGGHEYGKLLSLGIVQIVSSFNPSTCARMQLNMHVVHIWRMSKPNHHMHMQRSSSLSFNYAKITTNAPKHPHPTVRNHNSVGVKRPYLHELSFDHLHYGVAQHFPV
jgi:hypothetical protein